MTLFPSLESFAQTRKTLHIYSHSVGVIPRAHGIAHPKWWHISLKVRAEGLATDNIPLPDGGILTLTMDLRTHQVVLETSRGDRRTISMTEGLTGTQMGDQIIAAAADYGLDGDYARAKFEDDGERIYEPEQAERYFTVAVAVDGIFKIHMSGLTGVTSPVQLWPHNFDMSAEWFGTRIETFEEHGEVQEFPSQLNLGFYPGNEDTAPYFYSNPWPFEREVLLANPLPAGADWHTAGWEGTMLPYAELVGDANADGRLLEYARRVYDVASPTLMA